MKKENVPLHPLPIRIWHWFNALIVFVLIITGIELRFTDIKIFSDYGFVVSTPQICRIFAHVIISLLDRRISVHGRICRPLSRVHSRTCVHCPRQVAFYLYGYFRGGPNPFSANAQTRFNVLQKMAYSFIMFIAMPVMIIFGDHLRQHHGFLQDRPLRWVDSGSSTPSTS